MAIKSFLGADNIDEWRPKAAACSWGGSDGGDFTGDSGGGYNASDFSGDFSGDFGAPYSSDFNQADNSNQGFDNAGSWSSYNGMDAPFGAANTSPGESLFGTGGFSPDSGLVNFNEGQSYPGAYNDNGVVNFTEGGNYWNAGLPDAVSNYLNSGGPGNTPIGWPSDFGTYGGFGVPGIGLTNYAGHMTSPGLTAGFMDAGPFGMFQGSHDNDSIPTSALPNQGNLNSDLLSSTQYNQSLGELGGQYGRNADAMSQLANGMNQYYADSRAAADALNPQVSNVAGKSDFLGGYGRGGLDFNNTFGANFNPNNASLPLDYVASRGDLSPTNDLMATSPFGPANQFSGQPSLGGENATPGKGDMFGVEPAGDPGRIADAHNTNFAPSYQAAPSWAAASIPGIQSAPGFVGQPGWATPGLTAGLPASMFGYDTISNQDTKGDRGPVYGQSRESLNDAGRALLSDAFQSRAGQEILQDQRGMQDAQQAPWTSRAFQEPTDNNYPVYDFNQDPEYEGQNQNMGRPNSYPTFAEFMGPGRGQYAPDRAGLQVTVPGRVSEASRGVSSPFAQAQGRGTQGQMDALLAAARTAPTQAGRIAALDALNGLISATYGRGPNQSVGRGPYGGDPDPFIAQMLRMGR